MAGEQQRSAATAIDPPTRRDGRAAAAPPRPPEGAGAGPTQTPVAKFARLGVEPTQGLAETTAATRLREYGPNELIERGGKQPWLILWEQLTATMVLILVAAAALSAIVGDWKDASVILAIVVLFALLGFVQEYRAEKAMAALKRLAVPVVRVRRDGAVRELPASALVPGDLVLLEAGNVVPADARIVGGANLRIQEAALTGESEPVEKETEALPEPGLALGDRRNLAYMGTTVTYGRGQAIVVETGMRSELGRIATLLQAVKHEMTPLQRRLDQLGKFVGIVAVAVAGLIFLIGTLNGEGFRQMFLTAVSVAVAAVPEGLPAVVTITLAIGAQRMLKRQALLRKLPAVETLGSVTVICSDKTGTLTENRMTVTVLDVAGHRLDLDEQLSSAGRPLDMPQPGSGTGLAPAQALLLASGALCNDAILQDDAASGGVRALGDPTEGALVVAAAHFGLPQDTLERDFARVAELPFDSERKRMTTVHRWAASPADLPEALRAAHAAVQDQWSAPYLSVTKGAADGLLDRSSQVWSDGGVVPLTPDWRERIEAALDRLARNGMRVLGVAVRPLEEAPATVGTDMERDLTFIGIVGMIDPPRAEVADAVRTCRAAGIRPVMITGDHALTALHIAKQLGIATNDRVLTGQELDRLSTAELEGLVEQVAVYARVSPEHKLKIVEALQRRGHIVAMTGDGVNDAPALKRADIGVAMGITGTDVSKEAADMVLRDDNFATIVAAVEEGRTIYDNLRKFVKFSIAGNIGKVLTVLLGTAVLGPVLGMPLALLPLQLLWLNLLTDGLLGLGLGVEKAERQVMQRPPYAPGEGIFARGMPRHILWVGLLIGGVSLGLGIYEWRTGNPSWQTILFTALAFAQVGQALAIRSSTDSLFAIGLRSNPALLGTVLATIVLQLLVIYWAPLGDIFGTTALAAGDLALCIGAGLLVFSILELEKWWGRRATATRPGSVAVPAGG